MDWESHSASPAPEAPDPAPSERADPLSYKFQRLRERLREAIASGEFSGKLPGERLLARRFHVNAKTLSKALTDLAAEGVLERSIGRGTFVAGTQQQAVASRCLILTDSAPTPLVNELLRRNPEARCVPLSESIRPSLLGHCDYVINATQSVPDELYRDLLVRGIPLIETQRPHPTYSTSGVMLDRHHAGFDLARRLLMSGHEHIAVIEAAGRALSEAACLARDAYNPRAVITTMDESQLLLAVLEGLSAVICDGSQCAARVRFALEPGQTLTVQPPVALLAVGEASGDPPCSGIYLDPVEQVSHILSLLPNLQRHRPSVILLKGSYHDRGTTFRIAREVASPTVEVVPR